MKYILFILIGIALSITCMFLIPLWWAFIPLIFILTLCMRFKKGWRAFYTGFLIIFFAWLVLYFLHDRANNSVLSTKIAVLFSLPNQYLLFLIVSFFMALLAGISALSAQSLRKRK